MQVQYCITYIKLEIKLFGFDFMGKNNLNSARQAHNAVDEPGVGQLFFGEILKTWEKNKGGRNCLFPIKLGQLELKIAKKFGWKLHKSTNYWGGGPGGSWKTRPSRPLGTPVNSLDKIHWRNLGWFVHLCPWRKAWLRHWHNVYLTWLAVSTPPGKMHDWLW